MTESHVTVEGLGIIPVSFTDQGQGPAVLLLHGGGGPQTVAAFGERLAAEHGVRVIAPTHPGFGGTPRPDTLTTVSGLARLYAALLAELDLTDVTVVGNSVGGWVAAEMATGDCSRIGRFVIVDGVGIEVPGHPIADFFSLTPRQVAEHAYHDPDRFGIDPTRLSPEALQAMAANRAALAAYAGTSMSDPGLAGRLAGVTMPAVVVWGESDRIADPDYGRALAAAIPGARFELLPRTGHLPQLESPDLLLETIRTFTTQQR